MTDQFYNPLTQLAGPIAEEYAVSLSDIVSLLLRAGHDEALVRKALEESKHSNEAKAMQRLGRSFDLVAQARLRVQYALEQAKDDPPDGKTGWEDQA